MPICSRLRARVLSLLILLASGLAAEDHARSNRNWHRHQPRVLHDSLLKSPAGKSDSSAKKLTALAVAEYSGTRAVAYANYGGPDVFTTPHTPYTRHHPGRRVCTRSPATSNHHHSARQIRIVYTEMTSTGYICCPGWSQITRTSYGCNRPTCMASCHNGGVCGPHGKCNCPRGFSGSQCQLDIDECIAEKPCGQICKNLVGSYECHCRSGFELQPDGHFCRRNDSDGTAFEARDLLGDYDNVETTTKRPTTTSTRGVDTENEVSNVDSNRDYEMLLKRLTKLEKQFARGRKKEIESTELTTKVDQAISGVAELRLAAKNVLHFLRETFGPVRQEVFDMKNKFDQEHRRVDHLFQRIAEFERRFNTQSHHRIDGYISG